MAETMAGAADAPQLDAKELAALVEQERMQRAQRCLREVQTVLEKWHCDLGANARLTDDGRIVAEPAIRVI